LLIWIWNREHNVSRMRISRWLRQTSNATSIAAPQNKLNPKISPSLAIFSITCSTYVTRPRGRRGRGADVAERRAAAPRSPRRPKGAPMHIRAVMRSCAMVWAFMPYNIELNHRVVVAVQRLDQYPDPKPHSQECRLALDSNYLLGRLRIHLPLHCGKIGSHGCFSCLPRTLSPSK
jgi:hypothetical protein